MSFEFFGTSQPGHVEVQTVDQGEVELLGQRLEEVGGRVGHERFDRLIQVADEHQRGIGDYLGHAPAEPPVCHVVLHDLDHVGVVDAHPADLVKCHDVPVADQPDLAAARCCRKGWRCWPCRRK